ncbi:hypothetical protein [Actinophytocola sp.]|uniref:hypothetical protein n=1 Tax=Actinophytocola sp. TaxID=1872138 RepID=UPI003D6A81E1
MHATLFSLVVSDNPDLVAAWGMEITYTEEPDETDPQQKAILYIGAPNGEGSIATHTSAEAARDRWSMKVPLSLVWDADTWADAHAELDKQSLATRPSNAPCDDKQELDSEET